MSYIDYSAISAIYRNMFIPGFYYKSRITCKPHPFLKFTKITDT